MSLKVTKSKWLASAFVAASAAAAVGCGDDAAQGADAGSTNNIGGDGGAKTRTRCGTLVDITAANADAPILTPHKITVIDNVTGIPLDPPLSALTSSKDGTWCIKDIPNEKPIAFHSEGTGDDKAGTYDSVVINVKINTPDDPLSRIPNAGTANIANQTGGFTNKPDFASLTGAVYVVKDNKRVGAIGCAKIYIDDEPHPAEKYDERYINDQSLPITLDKQIQTLPNRGSFLFGNLPKGKHTLKATVDNGATFFAETEIFITMARQDASSAYKGLLYQVALDTDSDKTPANCK